ncbi:MAG: hypothetical protein DWQ45_18300 [Planctomycetota bacterium]|nr:MAG: hypothetical protein DWQ29_11125 [Planctomycetota bacterium]REK29455.1 MAG: hypothetical protein DWQ41_04050 [Planctomycetota bacterium]REK31820.1 MAG: hypothetical protein DWQ45_18300 [Planctomycetota bacterium]
MATAKDKVQEILQRLPDDASLESIEYEIYVQRKIRQGEEDVAAGRVLTMDEMQLRLGKWLEESAGQ